MSRTPARRTVSHQQGDAVVASPRRWQQILGADLRSLALARMGLGLLILADLLDRSRDLRAHYTDFGLLPRGPLLSYFNYGLTVCLHLITGTAVGTAILFALQGLSACLLFIGWRTRLMTVLSWFFLYSLHLRNPVVLQGGDDLLRMLLFWAMFLPIGARYSVDAALHDNHFGTSEAAPTHIVDGSTVCLTGQILLMYFSTAILKSGREWHGEGSAVYYALNFDQLALPLALWLRQYDWLTTPLTHLTLWWEGFGPLLLISPIAFGPLRTLAAAAFVAMHHGFGLCLMLGLFPWIDTVSMLALLPGWFWQRFGFSLPREVQTGVVVWVDGTCDFCKKMVFIMREFLLLPHVAVRPAAEDAAIAARMSSARSWVVVTPSGIYTSFSGFVALCRVSPLARPLANLLQQPLLWTLGERAYGWVSTHRGDWARRTDRWLPWRANPARTPYAVQALGMAAFALIAVWNTSSWPQARWHVPDDLRPIAYALRIDQDWGMFAPYPQKEDGWYVLEGHLGDGQSIDVWRDVPGHVSYDKPPLVSAMYKNQRWSKYMMNIWLARNAGYRLYFGQYLCRRHNGPMSVRGPDKLTDFEIVYMKEVTLPAHRPSRPERVSLWKHQCYEISKL